MEDRDQTQVCAVVINITDNDQYASANGLNNASVAVIAQELGVSANVVQNCLQQAGAPPSETTTPETTTPETTTVDNTVSETPEDKSGVMADTVPNKPLPNTGGLPLLGLAALGLVGAIAGASMLRAGLRRED